MRCVENKPGGVGLARRVCLGHHHLPSVSSGWLPLIAASAVFICLSTRAQPLPAGLPLLQDGFDSSSSHWQAEPKTDEREMGRPADGPARLGSGTRGPYPLSVPPRLASLAIAVLSLGAAEPLGQPVAFTSNTQIDAGDATYDGRDIVVSGCTLTITGTHSFSSLQAINSATVTHSAAIAGQPDRRIGLTIARDVMIAAGCKVSADGKGYGSGGGLGAGVAGDYGGGAGYGGSGGRAHNGAAGGLSYGSIPEPNALGSGGGKAPSYEGGAGGGVIRLTVGGTLTIEGSLTANGIGAHYAGSGSGGSIYVSAGTLAGKGTISANGGSDTYSYSYGGGGGGGRIAVYCNTRAFTGTVSACGGSGAENGAAGTIFTRLAGQVLGDLLIDNGGRSATASALTALASSETFNEVTVANQATLDLSAPDILTVNQLTIVDKGFVCLQTRMSSIANLRVKSGGTLSHLAGRGGFDLRVPGSVTIDSGGSISADGKGYGSGGGLGAGVAGDYGGGAGYGGSGGRAHNGAAGGLSYGSIPEPNALGSGGGKAPSYEGGAGGGVIRLTVGGTLTIEGSLTANGIGAHYAGSGSGGSIYVSAGTLAGKGTISANGGSDTYSYSYGGGGGGGRIAVYCNTRAFTGTVSACGGSGAENGAAGTIFTRLAGQVLGDLLIDNGGRSATASALTALASSETFNEVTVANQATLDLSAPDILTVNQLTIVDKGFVCLQTRMSSIANLRVKSGGTLSHLAGRGGFDLRVPGSVTIDSGGSISADGKGYNSGGGLGAGVAGDYGGGAGYGGSGGRAHNGAAGGLSYGSIPEPNALGSGGGKAPSYEGGAGGGVIRLTVGGTLTIEGSLTANGIGAHYAGSGSGGSIYVSAGTLAGKGTISANGGSDTYSYSYGGGGGGGRIAVYHVQADSFDPNRITANGGTGYEGGQAGTVFLSGPDGPIMLLYLGPFVRVPSLLDPTAGEKATVAYAVNMDCAVEMQISDPESNDKVVVTLPAQPAIAGAVQSMWWGGLDSAGRVCKDGFYDVTIIAKSGTQATTWSSRSADKTSPSVSSPKATAETRDPYKNIPLRIDFDIDTWGKLRLRILRHAVEDPVFTIMDNDQILAPGHHTFYWDGRDDKGKIYNRSIDKGNVDVDFRVPVGVHVAPILLQSTKLEIRDLTCNAYRIIPSFGEVSSISYELTKNAKVTIEIVDPDGSTFRTLVDGESRTAGRHLEEWNGKDGKRRTISVEGVYDIILTAEDGAAKCVTHGAISAFR